MKQVMELINDQNYLKALNVLDKLIMNEPYNHLALTEAGFCLAQIGKYAQAKDKLELASQFNPDDPWIWQQYAHVLFQMGRISASIKALKKAAKFKPHDMMINHQLAFLYLQNKEFDKALKYVDKALALANAENNPIYNAHLLNLKALIYEKTDKDAAIKIYLDIFDNFEDEPNSYDRFSSLIIDKFNFSKNLNKLNIEGPDYNKATQMLRLGKIDDAIILYKNVIQENKYCYPAYLGITQALYEKKFRIRNIDEFPYFEGISELFENYCQLNHIEKNIIHASIAPFANFINKLNKMNTHFVIVPIDVKLTDFPTNRHLKDTNYLKDVSYCSLRGIGGDNAYVGVERLRDFLWDVPLSTKFIPACVAHEFAHLVWCLLDDEIISKIKKLYNLAKKSNDFISNYAMENVQEYFAEYYALYTRLLSLNQEISLRDPMMQIINDLSGGLSD